jgi:putative transposase
MDLGHRAASVKFLIRDRAGQFTSSFDAVFTAASVRILASPPQAPRVNAVCERMIGTLAPRAARPHADRQRVPPAAGGDRVPDPLQHRPAPHRALDQLQPARAHTPPPQINLAEHQIRRKQVLDGLISQYQIAA